MEVVGKHSAASYVNQSNSALWHGQLITAILCGGSTACINAPLTHTGTRALALALRVMALSTSTQIALTERGVSWLRYGNGEREATVYIAMESTNTLHFSNNPLKSERMKIPHILPVLIASLILAACDNDNNSPEAPLLDRYVLSSEDSVPEGVAFDPKERAFYATSLQGASITRIASDGTKSIFRPADHRARLGGVKIDPDRRWLWVCAQQMETPDNRVWVYDLESTELVLEFFLGALSTNGSCNDLVLDERGIAYVTDPANPYLYKLDPDSGEGEVFATDPLFHDQTGAQLGLNGIAISPDGDALIVARYIPASLLRVSLPDAAEITELTLSGDTLPSPDGLAVLDGDVYSVANSHVSRIRLEGTTRGTVVNAELISGLSTATVAENELYVIKSEVTNFIVNQPLQLPFEIFRVERDLFEQH